MITNLEELSKEIQSIRKDKKIILATGTFDLLHYEHVNYLRGAKEQGDILIVGIKNNRAAGIKGDGRPIIDERQRIEIIDAIKYVDYSFLADYNPETLIEIEADNEKQREWLIVFEESFRVLKPDILYYENNPVLQTARDRVFEKYGIQGVMKPRGEGASTTDIIKKILETFK